MSQGLESGIPRIEIIFEMGEYMKSEKKIREIDLQFGHTSFFGLDFLKISD